MEQVEEKLESVVVEMVNEFEPAGKHGMRPSDFDVQCNGKCRNKVFQIRIRIPHGKEEPEIIYDSEKQFKEFGIEPDFANVIAMYKEALPVWKRVAEEAKKAEAEKTYKESWAHKALEEINELIVEKKDESVTAHLSHTLEEYVEAKKEDRLSSVELSIVIQYTGKIISVYYDNKVKYSFNTQTDRKYRFSEYPINGSYKERKYKKLSSLIKKFKELVDASIIRAKREAEKKAVRDNIKSALMGLEFKGCDVTSPEKEYYRDYRGRYEESSTWKLTVKFTGGSVIVRTIDSKSFSVAHLDKYIDLNVLQKYIEAQRRLGAKLIEEDKS